MTLPQPISDTTPPAPQPNRKRNILLFILFLIVSIGMLAVSAFLVISTIIQMFVVSEWIPAVDSPLSSFLLAAGIFFGGVLLIPCSVQAFRRMRGKPDAPAGIPPLRIGALLGLLAAWIAVAVVAQFTGEGKLAWLYLPLLTIGGMGIPVYLLFRIGSGGLEAGSRQRAWTIFGLGLVAGPAIASALEVIGYLLALLVVTLLFIVKPEWQQTWNQLSDQIANTTSLEDIIVMLGPILMNPLVIALLVLAMSVFVPIVEELAKPVGIWLLRKNPPTPRQGFVLGVISGAGFAILESLLAASSNTSDWGVAFVARTGGAVMHMLNTGLMGWAIARYYHEHKFKPLLRIFLLVILLHGSWNAITIGSVVGGLRVLTAPGQVDVAGAILTTVCLFGLAGLAVGGFIALVLVNRRLRPGSAAELPPPAPAAVMTSPVPPADLP